MKIFRLATVVVLLAAGAARQAYGLPAERSPITREQIHHALGASGAAVDLEQIELLSQMTSAEPNPRLKVVSIEPWNDSTAKVRMHCERAGACLPFYVLLRWQNQEHATSAMSDWTDSRRAGSPRKLRGEEILIRTGKAATLVFEGKNMRMTLPVVSLQTGARGQNIRVISKDRKRVYVARIVNSEIVMATIRD